LDLGFDLPVHIFNQLRRMETTKPGECSPVASFKEMIHYLSKLDDPDRLADLVSCTLLPKAKERQTILETVDLESRLKHLIHFLLAEIQRERKNPDS
jgi:ATP-dependent Lon protease